MEFSPFNPVVKLCIQGMALQQTGDAEAALAVFAKALEEAEDDYERFLASHYLASLQNSPEEKLNWLNRTLEYALGSDSDSAYSALPSVYLNIARCFEVLRDDNQVQVNLDLSEFHRKHPRDKGPFYHGTKADLSIGDLLVAGGLSNYQTDLKMNHIYFTAMPNGAGLAAALAKGEASERVYVVEPTGAFENDPNLTDKKFPGNPTRSFRSESPLRIVGELKDWVRPAEEELQKFRQKLENSNGEILN